AYAKLIQQVMQGFESGAAGTVWWAPAAIIALTSVNATAQYFKETTANQAVNRMETALRKTMFARLVATDLAKLQTEAPAGLASRFSSDIGLVGKAVSSVLGGITGIFSIIFTFFVMFSIDWELT
ncbi:ABC transporter transmembrane domain-containing protein, partial [Salmonella enterica subsp. enterica serovar 1,4,[5],12:i:-]